MKPNFALSLSFDGLRLMHRIPGGWELVGEVALDDPDLNGALAKLRATGEALSSEPMTTKLLLPNEQIKYLSIDSTRTSEADVLAALDGTTPYALDDLSFDFSKGGGRTYVAAVAQETLDEAEAFAKEHDFNPVCFVGVPDPFTYMGEPFFGAASGIAESDLDRDGGPVVVIGQAELPDEAPRVDAPDISPAESPAPVEDDAPEPPAPAEPTASPDEATEGAPVNDDVVVEDAPVVDDLVAEGAPDVDEAQDPDVAPQDADAPEPDQTPLFGSRRDADVPDAETEAASLSIATATPMAETLEEVDAAPPQTEVTGETDAPTEPADIAETPVSSAPVFGSRRDASAMRADPPPLAVPKDIDGSGPRLTGATRDDEPTQTVAEAPAIVAETPEIIDEAPAITGEAPDAVPESQAPALSASLIARRDDGPTPSEAANPPLDTDSKSLIAGAVSAAGGKFASRRMARQEAAEKARDKDKPAETERSKMTVFGARKPVTKPKKVIGGKPRFLGLILTAVLILLLLAVAALAALNEDTLSRWFGWGQDDATEFAAVTDSAAPEVAAVDPNPIVDSDLGATDALGSDVAMPSNGQVLSPAEAERIYVATGVWQRAPRIPNQPRSDTAENIAVSSGFAQAERLLPGGLPDTRDVAGDSVIAAMVNPPPPTAVFNYGDDGLVVATPDGAATPDGILVIAGAPPMNPPTRPGTVAPEVEPLDLIADIVPADAAPIADAPEGVVLVAGRPAIEPPVRPGTPPPAVIAQGVDGAVVEQSGEEGLVLISGRPTLEPPVRPGTPAPAAAPTPDATIAPPEEEGLNVIAGRPPLSPPTRPAAAPVAPQDPTVEGLNLIAGRPPLEPPTRPSAVAPSPAEPASPGGVGLDAFQRPPAGAIRPATRPDTIAAAAATLANAVPVLTASASTPRPATRPAGLVPAAAPTPDPVAAPAPEPEAAPAPEPEAAPATPTLELSAQIAAAVEQAANRPDPFATATALAVPQSRRPDTRPRNMARIVSRAAEAARAQPAAAAVSRPAQPSGRTPGSVAAAATDENAINLREINLIGVYGASSDRRALVRLSNGRYQRVTVGDRLDGGRVQAIGDNSIIYSKRNRNITLTVGG